MKDRFTNASSPQDGRLDAPATHRNREALLAVLMDHLPRSGHVLEIAAGTGQHGAFFARHFVDVRWQCTDPDARHRRSIDAWRSASTLPNLEPALDLDVGEHPWPVARADAILCVNMIHIAPWRACVELMRGAGRLLPIGGVLIMYGPYNVERRFTSASNARFDASLRQRDPQWGVRDIEDVSGEAQKNGLHRTAFLPMPANNYTVIFTRRAPPTADGE